MNGTKLIEKLRHIQPTCSFRERFQYCNLMYGVAGYLIEQVTGLKWSEYLRREITMPLELKNTYFSNTEIPIGKHLAKPYVKKGTSLSKCEYWDYFNDDVVSAGGSMSATAEDLIKWARFNLNYATSSVFNESFKHEYSKVHRVHIHDSQVSRIPYNENIGYGHGWFINLYRGKKVLFHTGSIDGFSSALAFIPESGTALAFNMNNTSDYRDNCILLFKLLDWRMIMNKKIFQDYLNDEVTEMTTYESGYVGNVVKLSTKRGNKYVAKEYPFVISKGDIKREWRALKFLQNFGMPVPRPIGFLKDEDNEIILMEHIDGRQLMDCLHEKNRLEDHYQFASLLVQLHNLPIDDLVLQTPQSPMDSTSFAMQLCELLESRLAAAGINKYHEIIQWLRGKSSSIAQKKLSMLHMDYHPGNILVSGNEMYILDVVYMVGDARYDIFWTYNMMRRFGEIHIANSFMDNYQAIIGVDQIEDADYFKVLTEFSYLVTCKTTPAKKEDEVDEGLLAFFELVCGESEAFIRHLMV